MTFSPKCFILHLILLLFSFFSLTNSRCSMAQDTEDYVRPAVGNETEPHTIQDNDTYCKDFIGVKTCCTQFQMQQLLKNFQIIESLFGGTGGCDVCVVNLKRFWCHFTCNPDQADFITLGDMNNYTIDGKTYLLRDINFSITDDANCALFHSCQKTKFVAQVPSMGNAIGFTNFQGINAYSKMPVYITMKIDNEKGLYYDNDVCNITVPTNGSIRGYENNINCSCNSCGDLCDYNTKVGISFMNGVNAWLIAGVYVFVFVATILLFFYKKKQEKYGTIDDEKQAVSMEYSSQ